MPVTEVVAIPLIAGSNVADKSSNAGRIWQTIVDTVSKADNCESLFYGHEVEHPDFVQMFVSWDSLKSHQNFMAGPEYGPMVEHLKQIMAGEPQFIHHEFPSTGKLTSAFSAPVTELATFYLPSKTSSFQSSLEHFAEVISSSDVSGFLGVASAWSIEDVEHEGFEAGKKGKAVLLAIGWESIDAHMAFRETDTFKNVIGFAREEPKGAELHHVAMLSS